MPVWDTILQSLADTGFIFFLFSPTVYIEPPEFEITDFTDHINVTVKFPSNLPKVLRNNSEDYLRLIISEETGGIVKTVSDP